MTTNFLGTLIITAYVATGHSCANNRLPTAHYTCAAPRDVKLGSLLQINGIGLRTVEDRTAKRFDSRIDLFVNTKQEAKRFGKKHLKVWIINK